MRATIVGVDAVRATEEIREGATTTTEGGEGDAVEAPIAAGEDVIIVNNLIVDREMVVVDEMGLPIPTPPPPRAVKAVLAPGAETDSNRQQQHPRHPE